MRYCIYSIEAVKMKYNRFIHLIWITPCIFIHCIWSHNCCPFHMIVRCTNPGDMWSLSVSFTRVSAYLCFFALFIAVLVADGTVTPMQIRGCAVFWFHTACITTLLQIVSTYSTHFFAKLIIRFVCWWNFSELHYLDIR